MPLDKFEMYLLAGQRLEKERRKAYVADTAAAVGAMFTKNGLEKVLKAFDETTE